MRRLISDVSAEPTLMMTPRVHDPSIATSGVLPDLNPEQMRALLQVGSLELFDTAIPCCDCVFNTFLRFTRMSSIAMIYPKT